MTTPSEFETITAKWIDDVAVTALTTTRLGGISEAPYDALNLGLHTDDKVEHVRHNRQLLQAGLCLPSAPRWLRQTHGTRVCDTAVLCADESFDAAWTDQPGQVLCVLTADCLPVVLSSDAAREVAVVHAGWRGLANGILQNSVRRFSVPGACVQAWLGPAIGPERFEVGDDVRELLARALPEYDAAAAFVDNGRPGKWLADLYRLATLALADAGVSRVLGGEYCTYIDERRFYSHRRDGNHSGRMATLAWLC